MGRRDVHRDDMRDDPTIAAFVLELQDAATATPAPVVGASLAAVLEGRAPVPAHPDVALPPVPRRSRRSLRLRWAVAGAAFGLSASSLGMAGALPGPVQRQVSRIADVVGIDLPDGNGGAEVDLTPTTPVPPIVPPSTVVVPPRPSVVPADDRPVLPANDRPVPSTVPDARSNREDGRGREGAEPSTDRRRDPAVDVEDVEQGRNGQSDAERELDEDRTEPAATGADRRASSTVEDDLPLGEEDLVERSVSRRNSSPPADVRHD